MQTTVDKVVREFPDNEVVVSLKPRETDSLCAALNRQLASSLPPGYVCRPPTEAELEYAWLANGTEMNVEKARIGVDTMIAFAEKGWVPKDLHWYRYSGEYQGIFLLPRQLPLNAWGLGMTSGVRYRTIDRIASEKGKLEEFVMPNEIVYADEEIDPVRQTNASVASYISRVGTRRQRSLVLKIPIHLVIGPDLLKERQQKK